MAARSQGRLREGQGRHLDAGRAHQACRCRRCFNGRRIVVFSGGEAKDLEGLFTEIRGLRDGGANGSIIGRNTFQRPRADALDMLDKIVGIYQGKM